MVPAEASAAQACLPLGLAQGWKVLRPVAAGQPLTWSDVAVDASSIAVRVRREMEAYFSAAKTSLAARKATTAAGTPQ